MNVFLKLEGFLSWDHVWLKECDWIFMDHPVYHSKFVRSFKWDTLHLCSTSNCKTARDQSWFSKGTFPFFLHQYTILPSYKHNLLQKSWYSHWLTFICKIRKNEWNQLRIHEIHSQMIKETMKFAANLALRAFQDTQHCFY